MIRNARSTASTVASHWSKNSESTRSPRAPMAREVRVTPSCIAAMKCGGSLVILTTERAVRLPSSASSFMRVRRTVTSAYSPATKNALSRISRTTATSSISKVIADTPVRSYRPGTLERRARSPRPGHWYSEASRRPLLRRSIGNSPVVLWSAERLPRARAARGARASPPPQTGAPTASGRHRRAGRRPRSRSAARLRARRRSRRVARRGGRSAPARGALGSRIGSP